MKSSLSRSLMYLTVTSASLFLTACGGDSSSDNGDSGEEHEHEHSGRLLISDDTTNLTVYDQSESAFETLAGNAALASPSLVLADNGLSAAVVNSSSVQFVHSGLHSEEEEEAGEEAGAEHDHEEADVINLTVSGSISKVVTSKGHFAILADGATQLVPADDIESVSAANIETFDAVTQSYPALVLDEDSETLLVFSNDNAVVYTEDSATAVSTSCSSPAWHVESEHMTLFGCDEGVKAMSMEGNFTEFTSLQKPATATEWPQNWISNGEDIVGYSADTVLAVYEDEDTDSIVVEDATTIATSGGASGNICSAAFATEDSDAIAFLSDDANLYVVDTDTDAVTTVVLKFSDASQLSCDDLHLTAAAAGFPVTDESSRYFYLIDAHDGSAYHLHSSVELDSGIGNIEDAVFMHAIESEAHEH